MACGGRQPRVAFDQRLSGGAGNRATWVTSEIDNFKAIGIIRRQPRRTGHIGCVLVCQTMSRDRFIAPGVIMTINLALPLLPARAVFLVACLMLGRSAPANDVRSVAVELASGRRFAGQLDPRSDKNALRLRFERGSASVVRPIEWHRVIHAEMEGEAVPVQDLLDVVANMERISPSSDNSHGTTTPLPAPRSAVAPREDATRSQSDRPAPTRPTTRPVRSEMPRVSSILADAWLANWDRDVENDGIVVQVIPLDASGRAMAVSGKLEVVLIGPRVRTFNEAPRARGFKFDHLGHWVRTVRAGASHEERVAYELPFQATHPEFDSRLGSHAFVSVRLTVPGSGTFQRTIDHVRIRPNSPLRDYKQLHFGSRWLAIEQTDRGKHQSP